VLRVINLSLNANGCNAPGKDAYSINSVNEDKAIEVADNNIIRKINNLSGNINNRIDEGKLFYF